MGVAVGDDERGERVARPAAMLGSLVIHAGILLIAAEFAVDLDESPSLASASVEIDFTPLEESPETPAPPIELPPDPAPDPVDVETARPPPTSARTTPRVPSPPAAALPPTTVDVEVDLETPRAPTRGFAIDPLSVARSLVGDPTTTPARPEAAAPVDAPDADEAMTAHLVERTNARDYLSVRGEPDLRRLPDGGYQLIGSVLGARIHPDGSVSFADRRGAAYDGDRSAALRLSFDVSDRVERRHGNDVWGAEREWFMRGTEELRARLAAEANAELSTMAVRRLRGSLERVWNAAELSDAERRRRVFDIWDECAERGEGARARERVEAFVRERFPAGSARAYGALELRALNRGRRSRQAFAPYEG